VHLNKHFLKRILTFVVEGERNVGADKKQSNLSGL